MNLKQMSLNQIRISNHALERAKQRLNVPDANVNLFVYEIKLKEIIQKAEYRGVDKNDFTYELIYDQKKYEVIATFAPDDCILIKTIIDK